MNAIALPLVVLTEANITAVALVVALTLAACTALGLVTWGLVLEARSNRCWRERGLTG
jgi:hypothetical protein